MNQILVKADDKFTFTCCYGY